MLIYSHLFYNEIHICPTRVRHTEGEGNYLVASRDIDAGEVTLLIHVGLAVGGVGVGLCLGELSHKHWSCYWFWSLSRC